ncbi:cyclic nucleotide-binding domain-containing protein [Dethiosulfatarculus sandiegensis]|uniref:3',5'-cyclic-nucleotide phosphodiesterase n=1 Tax=Dethiosulfatarculus sandiegensis TaxID=1429043 RepID=A0A0D2JNU1_9BACT|nr:cyclic nucleotide-binding domain-containing protein [Dethiosulfatarculus sandiegensis]KIX11160.1 3',5'-cyclic-nucleotide phosphodiesterase [Dethiosulfatarculus sandiegensis]
MLEDLLSYPEFKDRVEKVMPGSMLFWEGDQSQDLYILVSGRLDVLKGEAGIGQIVERGAVFGEMSMLLGQKRTASVKAVEKSEIIRIPKEELPEFLKKFPQVMQATSRLLAKRLDEASKALQGLKEFVDQLPDAVVVSDSTGKVITINNAAVKLYGQTWSELRLSPVKSLYKEPSEFSRYTEQIRESGIPAEKVFAMEHPETGLRYVSISTSLLKDSRNRFQGFLSLARDITNARVREDRFRKLLYWLVPTFLILTLSVGGWLYFKPSFGPRLPITDLRQKELRNQLAKDFFLLRSLVKPFFRNPSAKEMNTLFKDFFQVQDKDTGFYEGVVILDPDKKVLYAFCAGTGKPSPEMVGTTYGHLAFKGANDSLHKVLTLYRRGKMHPKGYKGLELAFEVREKEKLLGWLVFQMKSKLLKEEFGVSEGELLRYRFEERL